MEMFNDKRRSTIIHNTCELLQSAPGNREMYVASMNALGRPAADLALVLSISDLFCGMADNVDPRHVATVAFLVAAFWNQDEHALRYGGMFVADETDRKLLRDLQRGILPKVPKVIFAEEPRNPSRDN